MRLRKRLNQESNWPWYGPAAFALVIIIVGGLLIGLSLYQAQQEKRSNLQLDLRNAVVDIEARFASTREFLQLLGQELIDGRLDKEVFQRRVAGFLDSHPEISHISFADPDGFLNWVEPEDSVPLEGTQIAMAEGKRALRQAMETRKFVFSNAVASVGGGMGISLYVPIFHDDLYVGAFSAQFILSDLVDEAIKPAVLGRYAIAITRQDDTPLVYRSESGKLDSDMSGIIPVRLVDKSLTLKLTRYQSPWDWLFLALTLLCVGLTAGLAFSLWILAKDYHRRKQTQIELQAAKDAAVKANRAKSELIANISHELRTPLGAIHGFTDLLSRPEESGVSRLQCILAIRRNARHLLELVNDLLDMSKLEAGLLDITPMRIQLPREVHAIVQPFRAEAIAKGIRFVVQLQGSVPESVTTDARRMRQILTNLVGNAIKFTEKGVITLSLGMRFDAKRARRMLYFSIRDTGIGITPEQRAKLFHPFAQGDGSISRRFGGSGLGLALSRRLAELLGGELALEDSTPRVGSVFSVTLDPGPLEEARWITALDETDDAEEQRSACDAAELKGMRVLVVEDCPDNQIIYESFFRSAGADVVSAGDGYRALSLASAEAFDVIFLDIQMPELDGYRVAETLRERGIRTPIIAVTAHAMQGERERCLKVGCEEYLTKPVDADTLIRTARWYGRSRRQGGASEESYFLEEVMPMRSRLKDDPRVQPVLGDFVQGLQDRLRAMEEAMGLERWTELSRQAHRLKGTAANYGFPELAQAAAELEQDAGMGGRTTAGVVLKRLHDMNGRMLKGLMVP